MTCTINRNTALLIVVVFVALVFVRAETNSLMPSEWKFTHFLFNYNEEFLKRGLIGEVISWFHFPVSPGIVKIYSLGVLFAISSFIIFFSNKVYSGNPSPTTILFLGFLISSSGTLQHQIEEIGSYDSFLKVILIVSLLSLRLGSSSFAFLIILSGQIVSLFVHEGAFFFTAPVSYFLWSHRYRTERKFVPVLLFGGILSVLTLIISVFGVSDSMPYPERYSYYLERFGAVSPEALSILYRDLGENISYTLTEYSRGYRRWILDHFLMTVFMAPYFLFFAMLIGRLLVCRRIFELVVLLSALTPLALYPLGQDVFRWWSFSFFNLFVVVIYFALDSSMSNIVGVYFNRRYFWIYVVGISLSLISGPLGGIRAFQFSDELVKFLNGTGLF